MNTNFFSANNSGLPVALYFLARFCKLAKAHPSFVNQQCKLYISTPRVLIKCSETLKRDWNELHILIGTIFAAELSQSLTECLARTDPTKLAHQQILTAISSMNPCDFGKYVNSINYVKKHPWVYDFVLFHVHTLTSYARIIIHCVASGHSHHFVRRLRPSRRHHRYRRQQKRQQKQHR